MFLLSACTEQNPASSNKMQGKIEASINSNKENITEYIIVLNKGVETSDAMDALKKYDVQIVKDLKRGRYVIKLKNDPGIKLLEKEVLNSELIKHIQPNYVYTTQ